MANTELNNDVYNYENLLEIFKFHGIPSATESDALDGSRQVDKASDSTIRERLSYGLELSSTFSKKFLIPLYAVMCSLKAHRSSVTLRSVNISG
jgi:hypothetical protein